MAAARRPEDTMRTNWSFLACLIAAGLGGAACRDTGTTYTPPKDGAATVATLRALYVSGGNIWDGFWSQPRRKAA